MKLSIIIVICSIFQVSASSFAQQITLKQNGISLKSLFKEIKKQTGYEVIYADRILNDKKAINVSFQAAPLRTALNKAFEGLPVDFVIEENSIILSRKSQINKDKEKSTLAYEVKGFVGDENNQALPGVTVKAATSASASARSSSAQLLYTISKVTNADGTFTMNLGQTDEYLVFSFIGYETKIVKIGDLRFFKVNMVLSKNPLDEVQVIAYGTTTKRFSTGSVASLKQDQIEKQPVSNPLQVMEGRLPGVFITESAGIAGGGISVQIRGSNTVSSTARNPLYIVDGVPFNAAATEQSSGTFTSPAAILGGLGTFSPFDNIPTSDIESIEVLKDADATAIYGSRAANGVVVITTRKGKAGSMKINVNLYSGVSQVTNSLDMMNTEEFLAMRRQAFINDNLTPSTTNALDLLSLGNGNTDYFKEILGNTAHFTDATLSISGGSKQTQYLISGNYRYQSTVLPGEFADKKGTMRFSIQSQSDNNKFSVSLSGGYTKNVNNLPSATITSFYALAPNYPIYNADGTFYWTTSSTYTNPIAALQGPRNVSTDNFIANSTLKYNIVPGLSFKTDFGFNRITFNSVSALTRVARNPNTTTTGSVTTQQNYNDVYTVEPQLNFSRHLGPGKLDALVGATYQYSRYIQPSLIFGTFTNDALYNDLGSTTITLTSSGFTESKYASLFSRINYTLADKYILSFNGRRDASSRFGPGNRVGNFGSVGAAYLFTEEGFFKDRFSWLSFGKIRGSYGTLGNDQIGDYQYLSSYTNGAFATSYNGVTTLVPSNVANETLAWEVTKKLEFAADLNFLKDRIMFTGAWYRNRSNNLLVYAPLATQTGFSGFTGNLPATVQNTGWEFTVDTRNIRRKDFDWSTSINFTLPKNKLVDFPGLSSSAVYSSLYVIGQPLSVVQGYHFTGFNDGVAQFQDMDGSGTLTSGSYTTTGKGDYGVLGNTDPKFYGGISNTFRYKRLQLDFLFQFVKKDGYNVYNSTAIPGSTSNVPADVLSQPFKYTTLTSSAAGAAFTRYKISDGIFEDASYIRLKTVSVNYNFNTELVRRIGLKSLNVYMRGQNLLTFTKYFGFDPETMGTAIPPSKLISLGIQTSF